MHIKICGLTTLEDALAAVVAGADYLGFNFYAKSPRCLAPAACRAIIAALNGHGARVQTVGIFVEQSAAEVRQIMNETGLDLAQLHGDHQLAEVGGLRGRAFVAVRDPQDVDFEALAAFSGGAPAFLLDANRPGHYGGTGHTADWDAARPLAARYPFFLAGGLTPANVADAIRHVQPWGVDVASGVEAAPGRKDVGKMRAFVAAARSVQGNKGNMERLPSKFGPYGGQFVPETLMPALDELEATYLAARADPEFRAEFERLLASFVGRPTPLTHAARLSQRLGGAQIYLKREDLAHTGAHKINNALGQGLLVKRMGKRRIVAETGAGQHGVASATVAALLGLECVVYMGTVDIARQQPNVFRMKLLGAEVRPVASGTQTLKDAINEAIRDWVTNVRDTHYLLGSALGPHPYPTMVRDFQSVIGREAREQILEAAGRLPHVAVACVGGGSNAIGLFQGFRDDEDVALIGVEAGGAGVDTGRHAARFGDPARGRLGVIHGTRTFVLQNEDGQIADTHSVSAGLDYAAIGPEHVFLRDTERAFYTSATDDEALAAFQMLCETEGIIPALESSHAVAEAIKRAPTMRRDEVLLVNLSGRGDKDLDTVMKELRR